MQMNHNQLCIALTQRLLIGEAAEVVSQHASAWSGISVTRGHLTPGSLNTITHTPAACHCVDVTRKGVTQWHETITRIHTNVIPTHTVVNQKRGKVAILALHPKFQSHVCIYYNIFKTCPSWAKLNLHLETLGKVYQSWSKKHTVRFLLLWLQLHWEELLRWTIILIIKLADWWDRFMTADVLWMKSKSHVPVNCVITINFIKVVI